MFIGHPVELEHEVRIRWTQHRNEAVFFEKNSCYAQNCSNGAILDSKATFERPIKYIHFSEIAAYGSY